MSDDKSKGHTALPVRLALTDETTIIDANNVHLLTIAGDYDTDDERMAAWAALIVRAVNSFDELVAVVNELLSCPDIADNDHKDEETHAAERRARAILARAGKDTA